MALRCGITFGVVFVVMIGCSQSNPPSPGSAGPPVQDHPSGGPSSRKGIAGPDAVLFVDSVPRGAIVQMVNSHDQPIRELGKTPLTLKAADCPSKRFWVAMGMEDYLQRCERADAPLATWSVNFRKALDSGGDAASEFEFGPRSGLPDLFAESESGRVSFFGPVVQVDFPACNRICVPFIPKGFGPEDAFALMPSPGTFPIESPLGLVRQGIPEPTAVTAFEQLTRCGYASIVATTPDGRKRFVVTINGPDDQNPLVQNLTMISVYDLK